MKKPLDELYLEWLNDQVGDSVFHRKRTYWRILKQLLDKEFVWVVANDDNRIADGKDLRKEFVDETGLKNVDECWINQGCSMLELMIGLSRRLAFDLEGRPRVWFWHLMQNLYISKFDDASNFSTSEVDDILEKVIWRRYQPDGFGGLFPLKFPKEDQREVELWYQLSAYVLEMDQ